MVRIGGGWNTLDNYLARCDPCRCQKNSSAVVLPTSPTSSSGQSAISNTERVSEPQRQVLGGVRRNSNNLPSSPPRSSSAATMTTFTTTSGRQQSLSRRLSDLALTSQALAVGKANYRSVYQRSPPTTTSSADAMMRETNDVTVDSTIGEGCSSSRDNDSSMTCQGSVHSTSTVQQSDHHHPTVLSPTTSSPSLAAAAEATPASLAVDTSCSCSRLMGSDDAQRRSVDSRTPSRPSRIPVPLRVVAECPSHSASFFSDGAVNSPTNRQTYSHRHKRCDSGVDLNLSSPDFD